MHFVIGRSLVIQFEVDKSLVICFSLVISQYMKGSRELLLNIREVTQQKD